MNILWQCVALRKESVDRNWTAAGAVCVGLSSLSARRAWIEMGAYRRHYLEGHVALRKESVDRNVDASLLKASKTGSLSARRAWIEIQNSRRVRSVGGSLSARRAWIEIENPPHEYFVAMRRSPQGERG